MLKTQRSATHNAIGLCALILSLSAILSLAAGVSAQPSQALPGFSEVLDVRVVNLEVVVTDRAGNRVTDLKATDFELIVDGQATGIEFFSEIRDGLPEAGDGNLQGVSSLEVGQAVRTNYVLFVDEYFSKAQDRDRVIDRFVGQLDDLGVGDRVAAVAFDGKNLDLLTNWTSDREVIKDVLLRAKRRPTQGLQRLAEVRGNDNDRATSADLKLLTIERMQAAGGDIPDEPFGRVDLEPEERNYAYRLTAQLERSITAATSTLRSFAGVPGRKVMMLMVGGWPFAPAEYTVGSFSSIVEQASEGTIQTFFSVDLFSPLVDSANLTGFTLYPVDVPGQGTTIGPDASDDVSDFGRQGPDGSIRSSGTPREQQIHATLDYLADRTGGRSLRNSQRDHAFATVAADTRSYYWFGFSPNRAADDSRHSIEIKVRGRSDLTVRSRDGFVDQSSRAEVTMIVESALLFGDPPSVKPLRLNFGKPSKSFRKLRIPLEVGINMDDVTLIPNQGRYQNQLEIRISAMTDTGERSGTTLDVIKIDGAVPPKPGQYYWYETVVVLRKQPHRIVVAVHDPLTGELLSSSGEING